MAIVEVQRDLDPLLAVWTHTLSQVFAHVESGISRYQQWLQLRWLVLDQRVGGRISAVVASEMMKRLMGSSGGLQERQDGGMDMTLRRPPEKAGSRDAVCALALGHQHEVRR